MKKRSFVINLYGFLKKIIYTVLVSLLIFLSSYLGIPNYIANKMADTVFAEQNSEDFSSVFYLDGKTVLKNMMVYETPEEVPQEVPQETTQPKPENAPAKDVIPNTPKVDYANVKPQNAVSGNNIVVSNIPKKQFNINELLNRPLEFTKSKGYKVLVIHTHTTESYLPNDRSENQAENIVRVGEEITEILNKNGIKTLHSKTVHDSPYSKSYINEQKTLEKVLAENPSIEVVIDVHRDGLYNSKNEKIRPVTTINGEDAAQVMLVCGTDASGLTHENWESCFSFALKIQKNMTDNYPNLARPVNLRTERFNTHMTKNSVIFEIGSNGNSLKEALNGAKYAAQAIADVLNKK